MDRHIIKLKGGPSRCELFHAATYVYDADKVFPTFFTTETGNKIFVKITGILHTDKSGEHLHLEAVVDSCENKADMPEDHIDSDECVISFDCSVRKGQLEYYDYHPH